MNDRRFTRIGGLVAALAVAAPAMAHAQDRIDPAPSVRVVEVVVGSVYSRRTASDLRPAEVLRIQAALGAAGYDSGTRSGVLDGATIDALRRFQIDRGLGICGCVSYETVVALGIPVTVVARIEGQPAEIPAAAYGVIDGTVLYVPFLPVGRVGHDRGRGSGVIVGGEPARGAGQASSHPSGATPPGIRPAPPLRTGSSLRGGAP